MFAHDCFLEQYELLALQVQALRRKHPNSWMKMIKAKRLAAIVNLVSVETVQDPTREVYRQGKTLGEENKHWLRAKFYQQYRLFFRYRLEGKIIIYGWVNDPSTKRAYGSKSDAYKVFKKMLRSGRIPDDWDQLLSAAKAENDRFERLMDSPPLEDL